MQLSFAPLEGITDTFYRRAHAAVFGGVDRYFTPFLSPTFEGLTRRELVIAREAREEGNTVVQLMAKSSQNFLLAARQLSEMGHAEVNLNLGCPSGTVTAKRRGAGFLSVPDELDRFFDEVFAALPQYAPEMRVSVKARVGYAEEGEFPRLLSIFNRYPLSELIVHPRTRRDMYGGGVRHAAFALALAESRAPVTYNGDIFSAVDFAALIARYPALSRVMCGRGAVADPALFLSLRGEGLSLLEKKARLREFHDRLFEANLALLGDSRALRCRMADLWNFQIHLFFDTPGHARPFHAAATTAEYRAAAARLFRENELREGGVYLPPRR